MSPETRSRLYVLAAALLFSTGGAAIKATSFTGWQVAGFRSGFAALTIAMLLPPARASWTPRFALIGLIYTVMTVSFSLANKLTTAANAIFLQDSAPLYLILLGPLLLKEAVRRSDVVFLIVMAGGASLFFLGEQSASATAPNPSLGNMVAVISSVSWAMVIGILRWMERQGAGGEPGMAVVMSGNATSFLLCLGLALPVSGASWTDWATIVYLGCIQIAMGYVLLTRGVRGISALEASLLMVAEPTFSPIWAWLLHGERPSGLALAGGVLIIGSTIARVAWQARK
ncbi:MAG: EamA family transporter [Bryobacteraceae bacterium]